MQTKSSTCLPFCLISCNFKFMERYKDLRYTLSQLHFTLTVNRSTHSFFLLLNMSNKKRNERRTKGVRASLHETLVGDLEEREGKKYILTSNRRERRQPNTKHQGSLQQLSRREDMHTVQAARNINHEICI